MTDQGLTQYERDVVLLAMAFDEGADFGPLTAACARLRLANGEAAPEREADLPSAPTAFDIAVTERFDAWYSRLLIEKKGLVGPMDFVKFGGEVQSELDRAAIDEAANDERLRSKRQ